MEAFYALLARIIDTDRSIFPVARRSISTSYIGAADRPLMRHYMEEHLFRKVNLSADRTHLPDGSAADLAAESARYEELIREAGGIDLQVLGLGKAGHIGFN